MLSPNPPPGERDLRTGEAARILGVNPDTLRIWANAGKIAFTRDGHRRTYREADVYALAEAREARGHAVPEQP